MNISHFLFRNALNKPIRSFKKDLKTKKTLVLWSIRLLLIFSSLTPRFMESRSDFIHEDLPLELQAPWTTGPLLTPSSRLLPKGRINIQPYVYVSEVQGHFMYHGIRQSGATLHNVNFETYIAYGLTDWMNVIMMGQLFTNERQGKSYTAIGNSLLGFGFQLFQEDPKGFRPNGKFMVVESFPTGNYQNLDPTLGGLDATGDGTFCTRLAFVTGKAFQIKNYIWLSSRLALGYWYFTPTTVRNFNSYGGGFNTFGTVQRGSGFPASIGLELSMTQNLSLALDVLSLYFGANTFKGNPGTNFDGTPASVGYPSIYQISLAPAVEWNFSPGFGIILGGWFTVFDKNNDRFSSFVVAITLNK
ncbi:MAG: hypothetical protein FJZ62_00525 [Chlamydiae bacterium]|nr:hypothetical protein [Chlamydiota bacterium]